MSPKDRPISSSSRAESFERDWRVMRASFQDAIAPKRFAAIFVIRPAEKTATGVEVVNADIALFLRNAALAAMNLISGT